MSGISQELEHVLREVGNPQSAAYQIIYPDSLTIQQ